MARTLGSNLLQALEDDVYFVENEVPVGTINGANTVFTLAATPNPLTSLEVTMNGQEFKVTEDFTIVGDTLTYVTAPPTNSIHKVDYRLTPV